MMRAVTLGVGLALALAVPASAAAVPNGAAIAWAKLAIAEVQQRGNAASPALLPLYDRLARLRFNCGDLPAATAARRRALDVARHAFGSDSPKTAKAMVAFADSEIDRLHYLAAEGMLIIAGNMISDRLGPGAQARVPVLAGLARIALARGDLAPAEALARSAVALRAKDPHPRSSAALRILGAVLAAERKFPEGEAVLKQAVAFDRGQQDETATARSLSQLGNLYLRADRFAEALPALEEAAAIDQARLGPAHPFIADDWHDVAIAEQGLKRLALARRLLTDALALLRSGHGHNGTRIALSELDLSHVDRSLGDNEAADRAFKRAHRLLDAAQKAERKRERSA